MVNKIYREHRSQVSDRPDETVWVAEDLAIIAALRLRPVEHGHWLLGLFVQPDRRRHNLGSELVSAAMAGLDGPVWLFCHPSLSPFYFRLGFQPCQMLPEALASRLARYRQTQKLEALQHAP